MPRPTKYDAVIEDGVLIKGDVVRKIIERLRAGCTRRAACIAGGISTTTFATWLRDNLDFLELVEGAEAECEVQNTAMVEKAAFGYNATRTSRTVKTVVKPRKMYFPTGGTVRTRGPGGEITETHYPVGSRIEEPVALEEVSEQTTVEWQFSPQMALEWLRRRRRIDWGDKVEIDWKKLTSEQIIEILMRSVAAETGPAADPSAAGGEGEARGGGGEAGAGHPGPGV